MNKMKLIPAALLAASVSFSGGALAHNNDSNENYNSQDNCNINLQNGVTVTPEFVKVFDHNKTLYHITKNGTMEVDGKTLNLTSSQRQSAADYADGLRQAVPKAVAVATEAMAIASTAVNGAMGALFGENSDMQYKIDEVISKAKEKIGEKLQHSGETFTIAPDGMDDLDSFIDEELEQEIEKIAMSSMGSIFSLIGQAMQEGDGDFEQRMEKFGNKMEAWGEDFEKTMEAQGDQLEIQAEQLCFQLKAVDKLESELQKQVPEFAKYELLEIETNSRSRKWGHRRHHDDSDE